MVVLSVADAYAYNMLHNEQNSIFHFNPLSRSYASVYEIAENDAFVSG